MFDLLNLIVSPAFAADVAAPVVADATTVDSGTTIMRYMPIFLIFGVFYFLLIRPQQKQADAHDALIKKLKKGDKVVTRAGFVGTVTKADDDKHLMVEIAKGVIVQVVRDTITGLADESKPANENKNKKD